MKKVGKTIIRSRYECDKNDSFQTQWLVKVLNDSKFNCSEMAEALNVKKQTIYNWVYSRSKMTYIAVCAICMVFETKDDPNYIFDKIKEGWKS